MTKYHVTYRGEFETTIEASSEEEAIEVACGHDWYVCRDLWDDYFEVEEVEDEDEPN